MSETIGLYSVRESGLAVPAEKPKPPAPPEPWSLEFTGDKRREAHGALQRLYSLADTSGGIKLPGWQKSELRKRLIRQLADVLVGEDAGFCELT